MSKPKQPLPITAPIIATFAALGGTARHRQAQGTQAQPKTVQKWVFFSARFLWRVERTFAWLGQCRLLAKEVQKDHQQCRSLALVCPDALAPASTRLINSTAFYSRLQKY